MSEILILAVGCIGASLLEPPVADYDNKSKFRLQDRIALKFKKRLEGDLMRRLEHEETDVVEACYIMSCPFLSGIGNIPFVLPGQSNPLQIRPASPEGITRLIYSLGINRRPKLRRDCPPGDNRIWSTSNGRNITEMEMFRRMRIFWTCSVQNAFRSMGDRSSPVMADDEYDWDLPRFVPRQDGSYDSLIFCERESDAGSFTRINYGERKKDIVCLQANHFEDLDIIQVQVMLRLAFVVRTVSMKLVSTKSQGRSVLVTDVKRAVSALTSWYKQLPIKVTWEAQIKELQKARDTTNGSVSNSGKVSSSLMRNALKAFFVETLYHANVFNVWTSIDSFGTRVDLDLA